MFVFGQSKFTFVVMAIGLSIYLISYGPFLRLRYGADPPPPSPNELYCYYFDDPWTNENSHAIYLPVELLIDHTVARKPILWWCEFCRAGCKASFDYKMRFYVRNDL